MNIHDKFAQLSEVNEKALIAYVCAGDPGTEAKIGRAHV